MERRGFLKVIGAAVAGLALNEAIPFGRVWSFPSVIRPFFGLDPAYPERTFLVADYYYKRETLRIIENRLQLTEVLRSDLVDEFVKSELRVGSTVRIRIPQQFVLRDVLGRPIPAFHRPDRR